jgi:photosystem II stability/assembly factor-like uncharacterized protein
MTDLETELRATLAERAKEAPRGGRLAERILTEVSAPVPVLRPRRTWRTWSLPLLAAAAVASIVATVVGIDHMHSTAAGHTKIGVSTDSGSISNGPSGSVHPSPTPHPSKTTAPHVVPPPASDPAGVTGFRVMDLTFVGLKDGWAIGTANCLGGPGLCTAMFRTTDGQSWTSMPGEKFNVPMPNDSCNAPCVEHIRFATASIGYAYGPTTLFMTTDGGASWHRQPGGGAEALETFNGNVIRVVSPHTGCPGPCDISVKTAPVGSSTWTDVSLGSGQINAVGIQLTRSGSDAYILLTQNPAGGAQNETSTIYVSHDNGASWTARSEPCPNQSGEVDTIAIAASPGGVTIVCEPRGGGSASFVEVSTDGAKNFTRTTGMVPSVNPVQLTGDPATVMLLGGLGIETYQSTDGGAHWTAHDHKLRNAQWIGFESRSLGRLVNNAGRTIWTTRDGGHTWTSFSFG